MSCNGFNHGTQVQVLKDIRLRRKGRHPSGVRRKGRLPRTLYHVIPQGTKGIVQTVDRHKHQIDVLFKDFGLIKALPAHSFGLDLLLSGASANLALEH